ncbi:MAG: hypothetical protein U0232_28970 [Thermomicrobiales bacterium]
MEQLVSPDQLAAWCRRRLGAEPVSLLFESQHLSVVRGLQLADGRQVVVKARPPDERIAACVQVQHHLWASGFPCPEVLVGPAPLGALVATAEAYIPGGTTLPPGPDAPRLYAAALAASVALAPPPTALPTLAPPPAWVWWDHDQPGIWPIADDTDANLNAQPGPAWLDGAAQRVRQRLARCDHPAVVGHADWWSENLRWHGQHLHAVHDWDSVASQPEAALAGAASAVYLASYNPETIPNVAETAAFLDAYEQARGHHWTADEREICWAAGLWQRSFDAKKEFVARSNRALLDRLAAEVDERLQMASA